MSARPGKADDADVRAERSAAMNVRGRIGRGQAETAMICIVSAVGSSTTTAVPALRQMIEQGGQGAFRTVHSQ